MSKTNENKFKELKTAALEKVLPYFMDPLSYPIQKLSLDECAALMSPSAEKMLSRTAMCKCEHSALQKMKQGLARMGITSMADVL